MAKLKFGDTSSCPAMYSSSGGSTPSGTTEVPLIRISDDNGNEIGTWYMNFEDGSGNTYKVVCLDAQYRSNTKQWCSNYEIVTNMPTYDNNYSSWWYSDAKESATQNTQLILDYCSAGGYTSTACSHCRSKSFTIDNIIYYGQFPNMREVFEMWKNKNQINSMDTSADRITATNFKSKRSILSSTQTNASYCLSLESGGYINNCHKSNNYSLTCPVLEIPLN